MGIHLKNNSKDSLITAVTQHENINNVMTEGSEGGREGRNDRVSDASVIGRERGELKAGKLEWDDFHIS